MTGTEKRTLTLAHNPVAEHECDGFDCYPCLKADQDAAAARYETNAAKAKKFAARKRGKSVVESARPVALRTVNGVAGDVPRREYGEEAYNPTPKPETPLQQPLNDGTEPFTLGPAHLSEVTVARGFILAGNAYFTVRSTKTGVRYTYRVNRARCQRCQKTDCARFAHPSYFVSLLTGPDNTGDYTYLGMIRYGSYSNGGSATHYAWEFKATRATGAQASGKPFAAFRYVWERLNLGRMPENCEVWHEGRCGRCGRRLTVPSSIEMGIGPECAAKGGL